MMSRRCRAVFRAVVLVGAVLAGSSALADPPSSPPGRVPAELLARLRHVLPGGHFRSVAPTPIAGLYEVVFAGRVFYFTADGAYLLRGDLIDVKARHNLTEDRRKGMRLEALRALGEDSMIVYSAQNRRHTVTVFTDVDCPSCARFHREVPKLLERGVTVRYAAFPRGGIPSKSYDRLVSVWCAGDRRQAFDAAVSGQPVARARCENPVKRHFAEGHGLGVGGTPTLILDDGELISGYVPYRELLQMLGHG